MSVRRRKHLPLGLENNVIFPPKALWSKFVNTIVEHNKNKWVIMQVFQTYCVLDPRGYLFACEDTFEDAVAAHGLFHTWAADYARELGFESIEEYFNTFGHEPWIPPSILLRGEDRRPVSRYTADDITPWED